MLELVSGVLKKNELYLRQNNVPGNEDGEGEGPC